MSSYLLTLPREIRDQIYYHALRAQIVLSRGQLRGSKLRSHEVRWDKSSTCNGRAIAYLHPTNNPDETQPYLFAGFNLEQVNGQIRAEFLDYLRTAPLDIATTVTNFDFTDLNRCIRSLPQLRQSDFLVREDGNSTSILKINLRGPYNYHCRENLQQWIDLVESWAGFGELATSHGTGFGLCPGLQRPRYLAQARIITWLYDNYQAHRKGAARLELSKIFFTLFHSDGELGQLREARAPRSEYGRPRVGMLVA